MNIISSLIILSSSLSIFNNPVKNEKISYPCLNCEVTHKTGECILGTKTIDSSLIEDFVSEIKKNYSNDNILKAESHSDAIYFSKVPYVTPSDDAAPYYDYSSGSKLIVDHLYFENLRAFGANISESIFDYDVNGNLVEQFADNYVNGEKIGVCGYVAVQILLSYFNTFYTDTIIPASHVKYGKVFMPINYNYEMAQNKDFSPGSDHNFLKRLYYSGPSSSSILDNPRVFQFPWLINDIIGSWLLYAKHYDESLDFLMDYGGVTNFADAMTGNFNRNETINKAKQFIDDGKPVILTFFDPSNIKGLSHIVVAYGYTNDGRFIVNTGWGASSYQNIVNSEGKEICTSLDDRDERISYIDEKFLISYTNLNLSYSKIDENYHIYSYKPCSKHPLGSSNNYDAIDDWFCSCGKRMGSDNPFLIKDNMYRLGNEYCDEIRNAEFQIDNTLCFVNMYRVGFIDKKYLTLSAKTKGTNTAFIEYEFSRQINALTFDAALWSANESLKENSSIKIDIFTNNTWENYYVFNYDKMSKSKEKLYPYCFYFLNSINKFRIIINTNNVNNENNRGRMVIKNVKIYE